MGDAGSLSIGAIFCVLSINCINENFNLSPIWIKDLNKAVLTMSIMVYPLIDTLRVFVMRVIKGKSPLKADKKHIHHYFERTGIGHAKTSLILFIFSLSVILFQVFLQITLSVSNPSSLLFLQVSFSCSLIFVIYLSTRHLMKNKK